MTVKFSPSFMIETIFSFKFLNRDRGQSLFEVVFAIAIVSLLVMGIVSLSAKSVSNSDFAKNSTIATKFATEGMEWVRKYRDTDWDLFKAITGTSPGTRWCLNDLATPASSSCGTDKIGTTIFWREIVLTEDSGNPEIVNAVVEVSWVDSSGTHVVRTISDFTKWRI